MASGSKPGERRGGRPKGKANARTIEIKNMVETALQSAGGSKYLQRVAETDPSAFCSLVGKLIPREQKIELIQRATITLDGNGVKPAG